jgi:hypothetical protein
MSLAGVDGRRGRQARIVAAEETLKKRVRVTIEVYGATGERTSAP